MSVPRCWYLTYVVLAIAVYGTLSAQTPSAQTAATALGSPSEEIASLHPKEVYPQIVRLSLVQGDVRVAVGKVKGQPGVPPWVNAAVNMPLETGFSVVTGKGRAEIEFEDASTMYLGENSVLTFENLTTKNSVPNTEMTLLSGVADLNLHPTMPSEVYLLETSTDFIRVHAGQHSTLRLNSYTDTSTITPLIYTARDKDDPAAKLGLIGKSFTISGGRLYPAPDETAKADAAFDAWVAKRVQARSEAMHAVMKEAGLSEALPGLQDMAAKGTFFECKPYGTCWEPTNGWSGKPAAQPGGRLLTVAAKAPEQVQPAPTQQVPTQQASAQQVPTQQAPTQQAAPTPEQIQNAKLAQQAQRDEEQAEGQTEGGGVAPAMWVDDEDDFPCSPYAVENLMGQDPVTGRVDVLASDIVWNDDGFDGFGYDWAVCHAGSWIYWHRRYAWVAGRRQHHRCPVRWVKVGKKLGYVPTHPHDRDGKEPGNLRHGIFLQPDRKGGEVERVEYHQGTEVKVLGEAPREFRQPSLPMLRASSAPTLEARSLRGGLAGSKAMASTSMIAFDSRARGFTVRTQINEGGRSHMVVDHFGGGIGGGSSGRGFSGGGGHFGGGGGGHFGGGGGGGGHFSGGVGGGGGGHFGGGGGGGGGSHGGGGGGASGGGHGH